MRFKEQEEKAKGEVVYRNSAQIIEARFQKVLTNEKRKRVQEYFTTIASRYDLLNHILSLGLHRIWKKTAVNLLELKLGEVVIDVCGGTGDLALLTLEAVKPSGKVIVYDFNFSMLNAGRKKILPFQGNKILNWIQGDAEEIAFADNSFDVAMVGFGIRNLTHPEKGLEEIYRVLKPGGRLMCLEFSVPKVPWFRILYDFYSFFIFPIAGKLFAGSKEAYTYLFESIRAFPPPEEIVILLKKIGFSKIILHRLTLGIAVIYLGIKD